jgi:hypothetical protein
MRKGVRAGGGDAQPRLVGERGKLAAKLNHVLAGVGDRLANLRAQLDHRLVHLGLDLLLQKNFAAFENFLDVGTEFAGLRIDDRELLLNAEREGVVRGGHVTKNGERRRGASPGNT